MGKWQGEKVGVDILIALNSEIGLLQTSSLTASSSATTRAIDSKRKILILRRIDEVLIAEKEKSEREGKIWSPLAAVNKRGGGKRRKAKEIESKSGSGREERIDSMSSLSSSGNSGSYLAYVNTNRALTKYGLDYQQGNR